MSFLQQALPLLAAVFAIPQLLPQLLRLVRTRATAGVSATWASMTAASNLGWLTYFLATGLWTGAFPGATCAAIAIAITAALRVRGVATGWAVALGGTWLTILATVFALGGAAALGSILTIAFLLQVTPSMRTAWSAADRRGISRQTWLLIAAEVTCWGLLGILTDRVPLIVLGVTGGCAAATMLWLIRPGRDVDVRQADPPLTGRPAVP